MEAAASTSLSRSAAATYTMTRPQTELGDTAAAGRRQLAHRDFAVGSCLTTSPPRPRSQVLPSGVEQAYVMDLLARRLRSSVPAVLPRPKSRRPSHCNGDDRRTWCANGSTVPAHGGAH